MSFNKKERILFFLNMGALPQEVVRDLGGIELECHPRSEKLVYRVNNGFLHSYGRFSVFSPASLEKW